MTVAELIEQLKTAPQDAKVWFWNDNEPCSVTGIDSSADSRGYADGVCVLGSWD